MTHSAGQENREHRKTTIASAQARLARQPTTRAAAAGRVSVVASIGYCAFLGGPPLIGYLGQDVTVLRALVAVAVVLALATLVTGALRPLPVHSLPQATPDADPAYPPT